MKELEDELREIADFSSIEEALKEVNRLKQEIRENTRCVNHPERLTYAVRDGKTFCEECTNGTNERSADVSWEDL